MIQTSWFKYSAGAGPLFEGVAFALDRGGAHGEAILRVYVSLRFEVSA